MLLYSLISEVLNMSSKERAIQFLNDETLAAYAEVDEMKK